MTNLTDDSMASMVVMSNNQKHSVNEILLESTPKSSLEIISKWVTTTAKKLLWTNQSKKVCLNYKEIILIYLSPVQDKGEIQCLWFVFRPSRAEWKHRPDEHGKNGPRITRDVAWKKWVQKPSLHFREYWTYFMNYELVALIFPSTSVPGISEFAALNSITDRDDGVPSWTRGLSQEDINAMHRKWL